MKKVLVALGFALASTMASAITVNSLTVTGAAFTAVTPSDGGWGPINIIPEAGYMSGFAGTLTALADGVFTATYLGQQAAYGNFYLGSAQIKSVLNGGALGSTNSMNVTAGQTVAFSFGEDNNGDNISDIALFANGDANQQFRGILYFANTFNLADANGNQFDFLIGYNDLSPFE